MRHPVVAGVDGSPQSIAAAQWAAREAVRCGLPLLLVHAWRALPSMPGGPGVEPPPDDSHSVLAIARSAVRAEYPDLSIDTRELTFATPDGLVNASKEAELMVLGSRGLGGFAGLLLGSTGLDTAARSHCPVVLVRAGEGPADEYQRIDGDPVGALQPRPVVLGLDALHPSEALLDFALRTADRRGAALRVVYAWNLPSRMSVTPVRMGPSGHDQLQEQRTRTLNEALRGWDQKFPTVDIRPAVRFGSAAAVLVEEAGHAALVVVGRRATRPAMAMRLGPAAHAVMHHAVAPVAVVPHT